MTMVTAAVHCTPLLAGWRSQRRADLASHLAHHGPLPMPVRGDRSWARRFTAEVGASGLTGRGGAAFPSAVKLDSLVDGGGPATLIVNAMEGEPASAKDTVLLACAPHLVLDGAELAATASGASRIVVCVASDRPEGARAIARAVQERGTGALSPIPVAVAHPPGRYVGGEESALVRWLDGGPAAPTFRPDKTVPLVLGRRPALVHNAETLAHVALIARHGAEWFRSKGTAEAPGTCLVTVSGGVERPGVYEVPMGTSLRELVGNTGPGGEVAAVLVGGFGGAWVGPAALDTPYAPLPLAHMGAAVGPGVLVVLPRAACGIAETTLWRRHRPGSVSPSRRRGARRPQCHVGLRRGRLCPRRATAVRAPGGALCARARLSTSVKGGCREEPDRREPGGV
jgi:NADH:ubiquinone oxidoreductase subunit F (NADH-binding)